MLRHNASEMEYNFLSINEALSRGNASVTLVLWDRKEILKMNLQRRKFLLDTQCGFSTECCAAKKKGELNYGVHFENLRRNCATLDVFLHVDSRQKSSGWCWANIITIWFFFHPQNVACATVAHYCQGILNLQPRPSSKGALSHYIKQCSLQNSELFTRLVFFFFIKQSNFRVVIVCA